MTDAYYKARKLFVLFSSILATWEYIGITVPGEIEAPGLDTTVTIEHPEVIPLVIFLTVIYFSFRYTIEWRLAYEQQSQSRFTKMDVAVTYLIGISAVVVFVIQQLSGIRIAELLPVRIALMIGFPMLSVSGYFIWRPMHRQVQRSWGIIVIGSLFTSAGLASEGFASRYLTMSLLLVGILVSSWGFIHRFRKYNWKTRHYED